MESESDEEKLPVSKRSKRRRPDEVDAIMKEEAPSKKLKVDEEG